MAADTDGDNHVAEANGDDKMNVAAGDSPAATNGNGDPETAQVSSKTQSMSDIFTIVSFLLPSS